MQGKGAESRHASPQHGVREEWRGISLPWHPLSRSPRLQVPAPPVPGPRSHLLEGVAPLHFQSRATSMRQAKGSRTPLDSSSTRRRTQRNASLTWPRRLQADSGHRRADRRTEDGTAVPRGAGHGDAMVELNVHRQRVFEVRTSGIPGPCPLIQGRTCSRSKHKPPVPKLG
jgi:hypothetical protein